MNYEHINELKARREKILNSKKERFTRKEIGSLRVKPVEKQTFTIQIKLPALTENQNNYIPESLIEKFYNKEDVLFLTGIHYYYVLKEDKKEEANKVKIPLEVKKYFYDKESVLNRLTKEIEDYKKAIKHSCKVAEQNMKELQERLARYENLLK